MPADKHKRLPRQRRLKGRPVAIAVLVLLAAFAFQAVSSIEYKCSTYDEIVHLPAGYACLKTNDFRMSAENPPLAKMVAALPLLFCDIDGGFETPEWKSGLSWMYGWALFYNSGNDLDRILFPGRCAVVVLSLCLGLLIFFWARDLYGNGAALFALFLFAFSPNLLAHGRLVTTDVAIAFFFLLALYCFQRALKKTTLPNALLAGVALGLALLTKHTALILPLVFALIALARLPKGAQLLTPFLKTGAAKTLGQKAVVLAALFAVVFSVAYATLWAGYGFRFTAALDSNRAAFPMVKQMEEAELGKPASLLMFINRRRLLPQAYIAGIHHIRTTEKRPSFLDGEHNLTDTGHNRLNTKPWPHYFIMTSLYKTPVPLLILLAACAVTAPWMSRRAWRDEIPLACGFAVYFLFAMMSDMHIGHRHILPVIPLAIIFVSKAVNFVRPRPGFSPTTILLSTGCALLCIWYAYGTVSTFPHYLAYFNEIAGGPENGAEHLTDSNIDWGQDLLLLKRYAQDNDIGKLHLSYFGSADARYYGMKCEFLCSAFEPGGAPPGTPLSAKTTVIRQGDYVAISVTNLKETYPMGADIIVVIREFREHHRPVAIIGHSIYVFRAEKEIDLRDIRKGIIRSGNR